MKIYLPIVNHSDSIQISRHTPEEKVAKGT